MNSWKMQLELQARLLVKEIASLQGRVGGDLSDQTLAPLFEILQRMYAEDFPLADLRDKSHLLIRLKGGAFDEQPRLQLVSSILDSVSANITDLTKAILGSWSKGRISPSSLDLSLTGLAKGSLLFGLSVGDVGQEKAGLLGARDTLHASTLGALNSIDAVAHVIEGDDERVHIEAVSEQILDPRIRDAALLAVQRLAPSGRRGIESLSISRQDEKPARLTVAHRRAIRESLTKPVIHGEEIELRGYVREIDLDAHRFELRGVDDEEIRDVRCAYRDQRNIRARDLLGSYVRVSGLVERTADGIPRLLSVKDIEIRKQPPEEIFLVDDEDTPLPFLEDKRN
jgi:predicted RNA-binding protein